MILEVLADARKFVAQPDARVVQDIPRPDSRSLQDAGRSYGSRREHDFRRSQDGEPPAAATHRDTTRRLAVEQHLVHRGPEHDVEVRPAPRRFEILARRR